MKQEAGEEEGSRLFFVLFTVQIKTAGIAEW